MNTSQKLFTKDTTLILLGSFCYMSSSMLINPLIVGFTHSIGASAIIAGAITAIMNLTSLLFRPFAGQLTDRLSKFKIALFGGVLLLLDSIGYAIAHAVWLVAVFRVINGLGFALCSVCMATWLASLLPRNRIGTGMGYYGMMNALGMAIAPALGIFMYHTVGYRWAFMCAALFSLTLIILIQFIANHGQPRVNHASSQPPVSRHMPLTIFKLFNIKSSRWRLLSCCSRFPTLRLNPTLWNMSLHGTCTSLSVVSLSSMRSFFSPCA